MFIGARTVASHVELHLVRHADAAWTQLVRPWLTAAGGGRLQRSHVLVPTRGQAHALKQRCLAENVPLLGVEFLTPGLARKKWLSLSRTELAPAGGASPPAARPALGRELLLLGLRALIDRKLATLPPEDASRGFWRSLQSDPSRALEDFDEMIRAGFAARDFSAAPLREVFDGLESWVDQLGGALAPVQNEAAALQPPPPETPAAAQRLLVYGFTAEAWREFFGLAAFVRRCREIVVVLPEPEFHGQRALDERWIEIWRTFLGIEPSVLDAPEVKPAPARVIVGETRGEEMALVAEEIVRLLDAGAENIAVIFPRADAAHLRLVRLLGERGIAFADLLETAAPPPLEVQAQRALLAFYRDGGRLEELLTLWPLLRALGHVKASPGEVRAAGERLFDECHSHTLTACAERLLADRSEAFREVGRLASRLPSWPAELTLADALARFASLGAQFLLPPPPGWSALEAFAEKEKSLLPARLVLDTLELFLPAQAPAAGAPGRNVFARVTLTTRRRAESVSWSHVIFTESNAGVWPARREPSPWLTDEARTALNARGRFSLGLFTSEDRMALERQAAAALMREAREEVIFSAARHDETDPELPLAPNRFVERVLLPAAGAESLETAWAQCGQRPSAGPPVPAEEGWRKIHERRRNPAAPFDEFFFCGAAEKIRPASLPARLIERGVADPAELWFEAVLGVGPVDWRPLARAREKSLGLLAHRLIAAALRADATAGETFGRLPPQAEAREHLGRALAELRARWPQDRYWDSFHAELEGITVALLAQVFALRGGGYAATEWPLPRGKVRVPAGGASLPVHGRIDLVLLDRPEWRGAQVEIIDFKTGGDDRLSLQRMAEHGDSLQLGIYLAAAAALGAAGGRVWMLKPDGTRSSLIMAELPRALARLGQIARHLATGRYGALTQDRTEFVAGRPWPLACAPIGQEVLAAKFAVTFPETEAAHG